jgi:Zn-dependent protease with chaperone function
MRKIFLDILPPRKRKLLSMVVSEGLTEGKYMHDTANGRESESYSWLDSLIVPKQFSKAEYEYAADRMALATFKAIPGGDWIIKKFLNFYLNLKIPDLMGSAVKVSGTQFPEIHRLVLKISQVLGVEPPPVYLREDPTLNAETFGTDEKNVYVVVNRGLAEVARPRELAFVLGHEIGHIKSEHVLYLTIAHWLARGGIFALSRLPVVGDISRMLEYPAELVLNSWQRRAEITVDRAGLICCQDLVSAQRALALLGLGSRDLADQIHIDELEEQAVKGYGRWMEITRSHPYLPKRLKGIRLFSTSYFYLRCVKQDDHTPFLAPEDLDAAVGRVLGDDEIGEQPLTMESSDERRLKVMMAIAAAWEDGKLSEKEIIVITSLMEELALTTKERQPFSQFPKEAPARESLEKELKYFQGNKLSGLAHAFSILALEHPRYGRSQKSFLLELTKACGISEEIANNLVSSMKYRKEFFAEKCALHLCAHCSKVYALQYRRCSGCGVLSSSLIRLNLEESLRICGDCGIVVSEKDFDSCPGCGKKELLTLKRAQLLT